MDLNTRCTCVVQGSSEGDQCIFSYPIPFLWMISSFLISTTHFFFSSGVVEGSSNHKVTSGADALLIVLCCFHASEGHLNQFHPDISQVEK